MNEELLTVKELMGRLKVTKQAIYNFIKEGMPKETNKPPRFVWNNVLEWLKKRG